MIKVNDMETDDLYEIVTPLYGEHPSNLSKVSFIESVGELNSRLEQVATSLSVLFPVF
jgi:hypothetical protein